MALINAAYFPKIYYRPEFQNSTAHYVSVVPIPEILQQLC